MKLENLRSISNIIGVIAIPVVTLIIGNSYTESIKEREVQGRFVELAIDILRNEPNSENKNIRNWAVNVVNRYSGIKMNEPTKNDLINSIPIKNDFDDEIEEIHNKIRNGSSKDLGSSLIRLSKIYIEKGDLFQANVILSSIIGNSNIEADINEAKKLLKVLEEKNQINN